MEARTTRPLTAKSFVMTTCKPQLTVLVREYKGAKRLYLPSQSYLFPMHGTDSGAPGMCWHAHCAGIIHPTSLRGLELPPTLQEMRNRVRPFPAGAAAHCRWQ